ncbi:aromatic compound dioxygenase [Lentinus brumalis]|uniref:Aromatic compound dioxygenase n=1 Tax=Lentinus brumalis TaxID=2498619 RepID=A0A371DS01_9APHY|nr:aromatic compound dioxygenase [Polyporus brumalis]
MTLATTTDWAPYVGVALFIRLYSHIRSVFVMLVVDNPFLWYFGLRGANILDDIEGPFYIVGSPFVQVDEGKGVLASVDMLSKWGPFMFLVDVKDNKGDPVPYATLDCWQADSGGSYFLSSYTLRGKVTADAQGRVELLTVEPGAYRTRSGHLHIIVSGPEGTHKPMTTQAYVCPGNDPIHLARDMANYYRRRPDANMVTCWANPTADNVRGIQRFPALPADQVDLVKSIGKWNGKLKERGVGREIVAVAQHKITLTAV